MRFSSIVSLFVLSFGVFACGDQGEASDDAPASPAAESEVVKGSGAKSPTLGIELRQGDRSVAFARATEGKSEVAKVAMKPGDFALRFPKQKDNVAIQITAWTDASIFNANIGASSKTHRSFGEATGIASENGTLYLNKEGNNYLIDDRLVAVSDKVDEVSYAKVWIDGKSTSLSAQKRNIYLAVFIDKNQNNQFDAGEVEYLVLTY